MDITRRHLSGARKMAVKALDAVDTYLDARTDWSGVVHMPEGRLHLYSQHWDYVNNALKRGPNELSLDDNTYRGVYLIRY